METTRIHCPRCGHIQEIEIPQDKCLQFYRCEGCGNLIQASEESCCVICAYAGNNCQVSTLEQD